MRVDIQAIFSRTMKMAFVRETKYIKKQTCFYYLYSALKEFHHE